MTRLLLCAMLKKPTPDSAAPASIAARADTIPFAQPSGGKPDGSLEYRPHGQQPERLRLAPAVRLLEGVLGRAEAELEHTDGHRGDPGQPDHRSPGSTEDVAVGFPTR